jgi:hypothetical protein
LTPIVTRLVAASALVVLCGAPAGSVARPDDPPLSPVQIRDFLLTAKVIKHKDLGKGITRPSRLTLSDGTITHDAVFSSVQENQAVMKYAGGRTELDFVDSYGYNIAAYRLAELVGLDGMMPVTVEREWDHRKGSLAWWIDSKMDEETRLKQKIQPPDSEDWNRQMYRMRVFAQLVADTDRNLGNVLIGPDWKLWMIDFTRAFRHTRKLLAPGDLQRCDRQLLTRLRALTAEEVAARTAPFISRAEVEPLMARRDAIVAAFEKLIAERGEDRVLY